MNGPTVLHTTFAPVNRRDERDVELAQVDPRVARPSTRVGGGSPLVPCPGREEVAMTALRHHGRRAGDEHTRDFAGTRLTFRADASDTGGNHSVMDVLVRPGLEPPRTSTRTRTRPTTCSRTAGRPVAATPPATAGPARGCSCRGV